MEGAARSVAGIRRQAVLAALALAPGHVVSTDRLADLVWGDAAPPTAANTLQSHVSYLRRLLGARGAILARPPGYLLDLGAEATDVAAAERLIGQAERSADPGRRAGLLSEAVALWRGPPLADLPGFEREAQRLDQLLLRARRQLVDVRLELGEHAALLGELTELSRPEPPHEGGGGGVVRALYPGGRAGGGG